MGTGQTGQMDLNPERRKELGLLNQLALRQEEYRGLLRDIRETEDKSFIDGLTASEGMDEDQLVAVCCVLFELSHDSEREVQQSDILWAQEFIDHLDTLGYHVQRKWHSPDGHNEGLGSFD